MAAENTASLVKSCASPAMHLSKSWADSAPCNMQNAERLSSCACPENQCAKRIRRPGRVLHAHRNASSGIQNKRRYRGQWKRIVLDHRFRLQPSKRGVVHCVMFALKSIKPVAQLKLQGGFTRKAGSGSCVCNRRLHIVRGPGTAQLSDGFCYHDRVDGS